MSKITPKYIIWLVTRSHDHHYPVIMSANGKPCLNEGVKRKASLQLSIDRFLDAAYMGSAHVETRQITEAEFRKKFPRYPVNAGPKKKAKGKEFPKGTKVTVSAGAWGKCEAVVIGMGTKPEFRKVRITADTFKGHEGVWDIKDMKTR